MDSEQTRQNILDLNVGIPQSQIFVAGDKDIKTKVLGQTNSRGVDVILSCSNIYHSYAYWECLAPFGRVIDVGGDDGIDNHSIGISSLPRGASFTSFDLELLRQSNPAAISRYESLKRCIYSENLLLTLSSLMREIKILYAQGALQPPKFTVIPVAQVEEALRDWIPEEPVVLTYENKEQKIKVPLDPVPSVRPKTE